MSQPQPGSQAAAALAPALARTGAPAPGAPAQIAPSSAAKSPAAPAAQRRDTPRLLRRLTTALILAGLVFGLSGAVSFTGLALALDRAQANTAQLIRVQKIQTSLLTADAAATNAFLVGGLEPPAQRAAYDQAIAATGALIAEASDAQPADTRALSLLNQDVVDYAVTIEQARANNRQGFPVGAAYLRNASSELRAEALPVLDVLVQTNSDRAATAMDSRLGYLFAIMGFLVLAALLASMVWVARRFKRRINTGLAAASALVLIAWVAGLVALNQVGNDVADVKTGPFNSVNATANARIEANNAKSNESLTLIARGSGASFEKAWAASASEVDQSLSRLPAPGLVASWSTYQTTHRQIRQLDNGGRWDAAVSLATGSGARSANAVFGQFDQAATRLLDSVSATTAEGLAAPRPVLIALAVLTFLAGLAAGLLARAGLAQRLKEYR